MAGDGCTGMTDTGPLYASPDAVAARLHQIHDELHEIMGLLPDVFDNPMATDARYCQYNLQASALGVVFAASRITSPTEEYVKH